MKGVEFIISLRDKASEGIAKVGKAFAGAKKEADTLVGTIGTLKAKGENLRIAGDAATSQKDIRRLNDEIRQTEREVKRLENLPPESFMKRMSTLGGGMLGKIGAGIIGVFAVNQLRVFGGEVVGVTAKFQKYDAVLTNTFQNAEKGKAAMNMIRTLAKQTPYDVDTLTASYIKMVNRGLRPSMEEMTRMGDIAASQGKSFDQLVEAALDAQTGEMERLKEFGITAKRHGDEVAFTFRGQTKTVKMTDEAIQEYLYSLGKLPGVAGSMAVISGTLEGKMSNMKDASDEFKRSIGDRLAPAIGWAVEKMRGFYEWGSKHADLLLPLGVLVGGLATAMTVMSVATWANAMAQGGLTAAIIKQNIAMLANPWTWVVVAIVAVIAAIVWLAGKTEGWAKTWSNVTGLIKLHTKAFVSDMKVSWLGFVEVFARGVELIQRAWYKTKGLWDKKGSAAGLADLDRQRKERGEAMARARGERDALANEVKASKDKKVWEVKWKAEEAKPGDVPTTDKSGGAAQAAELQKRLDELARKYHELDGRGGGLWGIDRRDIAKDMEKLKKGSSAVLNDKNRNGVDDDEERRGDGAANAVASGGTRNTSITIHIGRQVENIIFQGGVQDNEKDIVAKFNELLARSLYMAEASM